MPLLCRSPGEQAISVAELPMAIDGAAAEAAEAAAIAAATRPASQSKRVPSGRGTRNPANQMLPRLASPPKLAGLSVALTHREAPRGASPEALVAAAGNVFKPEMLILWGSSHLEEPLVDESHADFKGKTQARTV
eukprot:1147347-Pelagomonas_calceolata.AAC.2